MWIWVIPVALAAGPADRTGTFDWDPAVVHEQLPNGVSWYFFPSTVPDKRVEIRLAVHAGSGVEREGERGYAHFVEHMAFNGTVHFPHRQLDDVLRDLGLTLGSDVNAETGIDRTVYRLSAPLDSGDDLVGPTMRWLGDVADGISFDPDEVEHERGVVLAELGDRTDAGGRFGISYLDYAWSGTPWADRSPLGTPDSIRATTADGLRAFWERTYVPANLSVVVTGPIDPARVRELVTASFGGLHHTGAATVTPVPTPASAPATIVQAPGIDDFGVWVYDTVPDAVDWSRAGARRRLVREVVASVMNARLQAKVLYSTDEWSAPGAWYERLTPTTYAWELGGRPYWDGLAAGYDAALQELRRLHDHGVTGAELNRAIADTKVGLTRLAASAPTRSSASHAEELVRHVIDGEPVMGDATEAAAELRWLAGISLGEVNAEAKGAWSGAARTALLVEPDAHGVSVPSRARLHEIETRPRISDAPKFAVPLALRWELPAAVKPDASAYDSDHDVWTWTWPNGACAVLHTSTGNPDTPIVFRARAIGGWASEPDSAAAIAAVPTLVRWTGAARHSSWDLKYALNLASASFATTVGPSTEGFSGAAPADGLATMLAAFHDTAVSPRVSETNVTAFDKNVEEDDALFVESQVDTAVERRLYAGRPEWLPIDTAAYKSLGRDQLLAAWDRHFGDAGDLVYAFSGPVSHVELEPLLDRAIGSLPARHPAPLGNEPARRALGVCPARPGTAPPTDLPPTSTEPIVVQDRRASRAVVEWAFVGPVPADVHENAVVAVLDRVLSDRLFDDLREDLGKVYGVDVDWEDLPDARTGVLLAASWRSDPADVDTLVAQTETILADLRDHPPDALAVTRAAKTLAPAGTPPEKSNSWWVRAVLDHVLGNTAGRFDPGWNAAVRAITPAEVNAAAKRWLDPARVVRVTVRP